MGHPIIVTPVSQLVATQAARNVLDGERWANVSDETVRYFLGHYGEPAAPVDPDVADKVLSRPRTEDLRRLEPLHLDGARDRFGARISDEELLLRLTMPKEQVDAALTSKPAPRRSGRPGRDPVVTLLQEVARRKDIRHLRVQAEDDVIVWRRGS
jgi:oxaloacetate decarboxylase alpha subunit